MGLILFLPCLSRTSAPPLPSLVVTIFSIYDHICLAAIFGANRPVNQHYGRFLVVIGWFRYVEFGKHFSLCLVAFNTSISESNRAHEALQVALCCEGSIT
jgi:hypothetical protein